MWGRIPGVGDWVGLKGAENDDDDELVHLRDGLFETGKIYIEI